MDINKIAQIADQLHPCDYRKATVHDLIIEAINNDGKFDDRDMAQLYQYFTLKIPAKPKTVEQWVAKAMPKDDIRYYLNYIYSDGNRIMATDGTRLHLAEIEYPAGYYDQNMNFIHPVDWAQYPDIDRLINNDRPHNIKFSDLMLFLYAVNGDQVGSFIFNNDIKINANYLKQSAQYFDNPIVKFSNKDTSVMIKTDGRLAIIMPMRF